MHKYDYKEALKKDVQKRIKDNGIDLSKMSVDELYDELFDDIHITGNANRNYQYQGTLAAENCLAYNIDLYREAVEFFYGEKIRISELEPRAMDTTIRCYLLYEVISELFSK